MAEARLIHRSIAINKALASLSSDRPRILFSWALPFLDVEGRITGDPDVLKALVCPLLKTHTPKSIEEDIADLARARLVTVYEVDGERYLYFTGFPRKQRVQIRRTTQRVRKDREAPSTIPPPPSVPADSGSAPALLPESAGRTPAQCNVMECNETHGQPESCPTGESTIPFERFWSIYPRKVAKKDALKAWDRLRPDEDLFEKIERAITAQFVSPSSRREGGRFVPHPATWLTGERWNDQTPTSVAAPANGAHVGDDPFKRMDEIERQARAEKAEVQP